MPAKRKRGPAAKKSQTLVGTSPRHGDRVYKALRDLIIRGRLAPGSRVVELEVCERLGVSRTPVREAIRRLAQEGFMRVGRESRRLQLVVSPLTDNDVTDLYSIMAALEGAAGRNVSNLPVPQRRQLVKDLRSRHAAFEQAARVPMPDFDRLFDLHNSFHMAFVDACATPRLRALIDQVRPQVYRYEFIYAPIVGPGYQHTFAEHRAMIRAFDDNAPDAAEEAIRANWINGAKRLSAAIRRRGPVGDYSIRDPDRPSRAHA